MLDVNIWLFNSTPMHHLRNNRIEPRLSNEDFLLSKQYSTTMKLLQSSCLTAWVFWSVDKKNNFQSLVRCYFFHSFFLVRLNECFFAVLVGILRSRDFNHRLIPFDIFLTSYLLFRSLHSRYFHRRYFPLRRFPDCFSTFPLSVFSFSVFNTKPHGSTPMKRLSFSFAGQSLTSFVVRVRGRSVQEICPRAICLMNMIVF